MSAHRLSLPRRPFGAARTRIGVATALVTTLATALMAAPTAHAAESYILWDNFNNQTQFNAALWQSLERTRLVKDGALRIIQRDVGTQADNTGFTFSNWNTRGKDASGVRQIRAIVTVSDIAVTGCAFNSTYSSFAAARILGEFFNTDSTTPTSRINDVGAYIQIQRTSSSTDPAGTLRVNAGIYKCTATDCSTNIGLGGIDLGTTTLGTAETLRLEWEPELKRFNFQRNSDTKQSLTYTENEAQPAFEPFRLLGTRTNMANCLSGPRTESYISAKFDNLAVNSSSAPTP
jgi:hypothetical protein